MTTRLRVEASGRRDIVSVRDFAAPATTLFAALTRPELLRRWHGARGWNLTVCEVDLRPGGVWRFVSSGPGGSEMELCGVYREVDPPHRLVHTEIHDGWIAGEALVTTVLVERGDATTMTVTARYPSPDARERVLRSPMERGLGEAYRRLDAALPTAFEVRSSEREQS